MWHDMTETKIWNENFSFPQLLLYHAHIFSLRDYIPSSAFEFSFRVNKLSLIFSLFSSLSLFTASNNFKGLLLRSHVLHRLKHYQSSLADVDNAITTKPFSYKVSWTPNRIKSKATTPKLMPNDNENNKSQGKRRKSIFIFQEEQMLARSRQQTIQIHPHFYFCDSALLCWANLFFGRRNEFKGKY